MAPKNSLFLSLALILTAARAPVVTAAPPLQPHLADYDAELRKPDGRVDTLALAQRLAELGATRYYWLIWHAATDWDDLKLFLPQAANAHLETWVYLVPPTEGPPGGYAASEPFKLDYMRWAEEIARLSLQHTNLTGWIIDDFYANSQLFTPAYLRQMQAKAKGINPRLVFLPLMYFPEMTPQFAANYCDAIDGVVVAYPQDREEIRHARAVLNGAASMMPGELSCPWDTATREGDFVSASIPARALSTNHPRLRFLERDDFTGPTAGYHFKQVTVDGTVVWEEDVAGGTNGWRLVDLDLGNPVSGKTNVTLAFRLLDKKGVSNFGIHWRVKDVHAEGLQPASFSPESPEWKVDQQGPFAAGFGLPPASGQRQFHIPFIVMTAASPDEFRMRHGDPANPEGIAEWLRMSLQAWREGQCDGVVTYCLDKGAKSQVFPLARKLFGEYRNGPH